MAMGTTITAFDRATLDLLARELAETVTHRDVTLLLQQCCIKENGGSPRWERMLLAWSEQQSRDGCANSIVQFLSQILKPVRFLNRQDDLIRARDGVNRILSFSGLAIGEDGTPKRVDVSRTLSDVNRRVSSL